MGIERLYRNNYIESMDLGAYIEEVCQDMDSSVINCPVQVDAQRGISARLGGDEFAVLMPNCDSQQAEWTARRLIRAIKETHFSWGSDTFRIGASIGATVINHQSPELSEILHQADMACYAAKERGRNRLSFYNGRRRTFVDSFSNAARVKGP